MVGQEQATATCGNRRMGRQKTMMPHTSQVRRRKLSLVAIAVFATVAIAGTTLSAAEPVQFEKHVRPILKTHCFLCHREAGVIKGKLDLRLRRCGCGS